MKECFLTRGDLALCLKGRRGDTQREVSRGRRSRPTRGAGRDTCWGPGTREGEPTTRLETREGEKGAAGVDGLDIARAGEHLKHAWPAISQHLLDGTYNRPQPVARAGIPKPDGSERELGIPTMIWIAAC